ncbi:hypothetical protein ABS71_15365 [bacterium SCN 62-11]|nr:MAG: hypothetical protein ABS71_15365 [bacterium SCN 62-11]
MAGGLCSWVLPVPSLAVVVTLLSLVVAAINLRPPDYPIPDELTVFGFFLGLVRPLAGLPMALAGCAACLALFWLIERTGQMGRGCTKWAGVLGLLVGWPLALMAPMLAFMLGALMAIPMTLLGKDAKAMIPFGIFLSLGGIVTIWGGPIFLKWLEFDF